MREGGRREWGRGKGENEGEGGWAVRGRAEPSSPFIEVGARHILVVIVIVCLVVGMGAPRRW
jgi:hypothetical protein